MTQTDFQHLKRRASAKPACLGLGLLNAALLQMQSLESRRAENSERVTAVTETGSEKRVPFEKQRPGQGQ